MGMFDELRCRYPLPVEGANSLEYQTKDTPAQLMDLYEIREDGTLWHEDYDIEDHSEAQKWRVANPDRELPDELKGLKGLVGCASRVNNRWERVLDFTGEICFYARLRSDHTSWIEWSSYFEHGRLSRLNLICHDMPTEADDHRTQSSR